jgi:elongation factor G
LKSITGYPATTPESAASLIPSNVGLINSLGIDPPTFDGIKEAALSGVVAGYPVIDFKITLYDGSFHDVDSNEMAFRIVGSMAIKEAMKKCQPKLLEPIMDLEVVMPDEYLGAVMGDVTSRRGIVKKYEPRDKTQVLNATVPLSQMFGYATDLRSLTQGRAVFTMSFADYQHAPRQVEENIIEKFQGKVVA